MDVEQVRPNMVLTQENPHQILFEFKAAKWGILTLFLAIVASVAAYFVVTKTDIGPPGGIIGVIVSGLFIFSSLQSFMSRRSLNVSLSKRSTNYIDSTLFKRIQWTKSFTDFKEIALVKRRLTSQRMHGIRWGVKLVTDEGEELNISPGEFGMLENQAREFATRIATKMGLAIVEPGTT